MKADITTLDNKKAGSIETIWMPFLASSHVLTLLHRMVRYQLAKRQAGTHIRPRAALKFRVRPGSSFVKKVLAERVMVTEKLTYFVVAESPLVLLHARMQANCQRKVRALALRHALSAKVVKQKN